MKKFSVILVTLLLVVGCSHKPLTEAEQMLVEHLLADYQYYFDYPLVVNDYSATVYDEKSLVDQQSKEPIYGGDRVTLMRNGEAKEGEVARLTGEYKDGNLNGIFVEIHSKPGEVFEDSLEQVAVAFLDKYDLAHEVTLLEQKEKENEREVIFRFECSNQEVIKVYVNQDLKKVVGFLKTDGEDL